MAQVFDFSRITREAPRKSLLDQLREDPNYAWVTGLLDEDTDEYVARQLNEPPSAFDLVVAAAQRYRKYNPAYVADNLAAGLDLLNRALLRRTEIQGLESQSITLALQYLLEDKQRDDQFHIAKLHALNAIAGSAQPPTGYLSSLDRQKQVQDEAHLARLKVHLAEGSALNFAQRVGHLRSLYLIDVKEAWARLRTADLAIRQLIGPVPGLSWPGLPTPDGSASDLPRLIAWVNTASHTHAALRQREREEVLSVDLWLCVPDLQRQLEAVAATSEKLPIRFIISKAGLWPGRGVVAILGVDMVMRSGVKTINHLNSQDKAYVFSDDQETRNENRRRTQTISARVGLELPPQGQSADCSDHQSSEPPTRLRATERDERNTSASGYR